MKTSSKIAIAAAAVGLFFLTRKKGSISGIGSIGTKRTKLRIILQNNPAHDDYHTWIRSIEDIKDFEELVWDLANGIDVTLTPDFNGDDIRRALQTKHILLYSSYPIKNGTWVTPSKMIAEDYAGGGQIYKKQAHIDDVAWVDFTEGMYTDLYES